MTHIADEFSQGISPTQDDMPTSEPLLWPTPRNQDSKHGTATEWEMGTDRKLLHIEIAKRLTSSRAASPASRLAMPASDRARTMIATSGRKCFELYELSGPYGSWQRTFMASLLTRAEHCSTRFTTTWKAKATKRSRRLFFQLAPSARRIGGTGCGLWPTAQAHDATGPRGKNNTFSDNHYYPHDLATAVIWPTPNVPNGGRQPRGGRTTTGMTPDGKKRQVGLHNRVRMEGEIGGQLNPTFVEWLMGYPKNWTEVE